MLLTFVLYSLPRPSKCSRPTNICILMVTSLLTTLPPFKISASDTILFCCSKLMNHQQTNRTPITISHCRRVSSSLTLSLFSHYCNQSISHSVELVFDSPRHPSLSATGFFGILVDSGTLLLRIAYAGLRHTLL